MAIGKIFAAMSTSLQPSASSATVSDAFFAPLLAAAKGNPHARRCPSISDDEWLQLGVRRVLEQEPSGRGFVQAMRDSGYADIAVSSLFDNLASPRRLLGCRWSAQALQQEVDRQRRACDPLAIYSCLDAFAIFAGDGHYHEKATHDLARLGHDTATQHFYSLDMRTHALRHITAAITGPTHDAAQAASIRKRENDMHAIKRLGHEAMRLGTPCGRKVLHVWDRAGIDLSLWTNWKARHGIYFISRLKDLMIPNKTKDFVFDAQDPVNAGIESDIAALSAGGSPFRLISYICPATGERYQFITSENTLPPGIIAYLYKMRWDIEKVFDQVKIKCGEKKSWGSSAETKEVQAIFICIAHNLMLLLEDKLLRENRIANEREEKRKSERSDSYQALAVKAGRIVAPMYRLIARMSQRCVPFIRWLRNHLRSRGLWDQSLAALRHIYGLPTR
jgi:Transposase DDE domain